MSGEHITIFTEQERTPEIPEDQALGPHLRNAEIVRLLQEILDLNRALKVVALGAIKHKSEPLSPCESSIDRRSLDRMAEIARVANGDVYYDVFATRDLIILSRTKVASLLGSLWESLAQRRLTSDKKTDRLVVRKKHASLLAWNGTGQDQVLEPVPEDAMIAILKEYRSALTKTLDRLQKSS